MPLRMKRLLELIFIFCAMPMAFSECVMCYHQVLIMQLKWKKFKSSALLALSAVCTLPKALLEQIHDQFWSKITMFQEKESNRWCLERNRHFESLYYIFIQILLPFSIKNCLIWIWLKFGKSAQCTFSLYLLSKSWEDRSLWKYYIEKKMQWKTGCSYILNLQVFYFD